MAIRPEFRWWILTVVVVGVLLVISALALDRSNVVWELGKAQCPHCRAEVAFYSSRCQTCGEQYDWTIAPDERSPLSRWSLSALEAEYVRVRIDALGEETATARTAKALGFSVDAAQAYLDQVGRGLCGWCGGTGRDLSATKDDEPCPVCFGRRECVACGGDRRSRLGDEAAHRALLEYKEGVSDLHATGVLSDADKCEEARKLAEAFIQRHAGTVEVADVDFCVEWPPKRSAVEAARARLDRLLRVLGAD